MAEANGCPHCGYDCTEGLRNKLHATEARVVELESLINSPQTADFLEAVRTEAAHQVERWGSEHDEGKTDADWFWLIGYLAGKAIRPAQKEEKVLHHIITTAAACLNWHRHKSGENTKMRPGTQGLDAITRRVKGG